MRKVKYALLEIKYSKIGFRCADIGGSKAVLMVDFENEKGLFVKAMSEFKPGKCKCIGQYNEHVLGKRSNQKFLKKKANKSDENPIPCKDLHNWSCCRFWYEYEPAQS